MTDEIVLYTNPMSRGRIARWMLEEVGQPYRTEVLDYGTTMKEPGYLSINPMGKVPALRHGESVVTEAAAICAYLADAFPDARLAPLPGDRRRAAYYRWMFFAAGPVEAAVTNKTLGFQVPEGRERMAGYGTFEDVMNAMESAVSSSDYVAGDAFTAADVYFGSLDRIWDDVWHDREAPGFRTVLGTGQRPPCCGTRQGDRRRAHAEAAVEPAQPQARTRQRRGWPPRFCELPVKRPRGGRPCRSSTRRSICGRAARPLAITARSRVYGKDELLREMREAGVDAAVIHPPSWDPKSNELAVEAARRASRHVRRPRLRAARPAGGKPAAGGELEAPPGMLGLRYALIRPEQQNWHGTARWIGSGRKPSVRAADRPDGEPFFPVAGADRRAASGDFG